MNVGAIYKGALIVIEKGLDKIGMVRWNYLTIALKGFKIIILSAYRVSKETTNLDRTHHICNSGGSWQRSKINQTQENRCYFTSRNFEERREQE